MAAPRSKRSRAAAATSSKTEVPPFAFDRRASGLLMHVTSLPGPHGSGDLSIDAARFIDFCVDAGQTMWQMLPVGPPGGPPGNSPYSSYSSAAGSPYLVSLQDLADSYGLLSRRELRPPKGVDDRKVNFQTVRAFRDERLRLAFDRYRGGKGPPYLTSSFGAFARRERHWLDDFALFCALKRKFQDAAWDHWDKPLRSRDRAALARAAAELADELDFHRFVQFAFDRQWWTLRAIAQMRGVALVGDIPIFVIHDSVDVWVDRQLFQLDASGKAKCISGVPPDAFSDDGQRWGHPHYDWPAHRRQRFRWWVRRFERTFRLFDAVRIDHFLGFSRVWSIPSNSRTARHGRWVESPGHDLFQTLRRDGAGTWMGGAIIAEDLGVLTPQAAALRDAFAFPGMRVMQFGFGGSGGDPYHRPHAYPPRSVAYTGTHDSDTVVGWFKKLPAADRRNALDYTGGDAADFHWSAIRALMGSAAETVIFPVQDVLGLDNAARMNVPGVANGNWGWRLPPGALKPAHAKRIRRMVELTDRLAGRGR